MAFIAYATFSLFYIGFVEYTRWNFFLSTNAFMSLISKLF